MHSHCVRRRGEPQPLPLGAHAQREAAGWSNGDLSFARKSAPRSGDAKCKSFAGDLPGGKLFRSDMPYLTPHTAVLGV